MESGAVAQILKTDALGRVRIPAARREELLDEFERSGMSGVTVPLASIQKSCCQPFANSFEDPDLAMRQRPGIVHVKCPGYQPHSQLPRHARHLTATQTMQSILRYY